jgi:uridine kinase
VTPLVIGIAGGAGSGKTTVARRLLEALPGRCVLIEHDWYYRDRSHMPEADRETVNYDQAARRAGRRRHGGDRI